MKNTKFMAMMMAVAVAAALTSCDKDPEPSPNPSPIPTQGTELNNSGKWQLVGCNNLIIKYDEQGKVVEYGYNGSNRSDTYSYYSNRIVYEYGDPTNHTFTFNNGLINMLYAPGSEDAAYKYNTAGQLTEVLVYDDYEKDKTVYGRIEYTWENGCITEVYDIYKGYTNNYFYLDYEDKSRINDDCIKYINALTLGEYFYFTNDFLYATGYFGKIPDKLITKISQRGTSSDDYTVEILSIDNNGCPTSIKLYRPNNAMSGIYQLKWKKNKND